MHDSLPVRFVQSVGDLDAVAQRLLQRQRTLGETIRQRLALEKFHDQKLDFTLSTDVVERADVRMGELRDCFRFPLETLTNLLGRGEPLRQDFDRYGPPEPRVPSPVHLAHPARAERREDLVRAQPGAGGQDHLFASEVQFDTSTSDDGWVLGTSSFIRKRWPPGDT